ncbi:MAG: hypothetical protein M3Z97_10785 [Candidatus Dormibacteraeota bacterium]|nr:hypothetical protein [Candidatus Dormibacteraeota bacterium]
MDSTSPGPAKTSPARRKRPRKYWSPLSVLIVFTLLAFSVQYLALFAALFLAIGANHPFSFHVALGPLQFWQGYFASTMSTPEPGHFIANRGGSVELREGAVLVSFVVGALAAVIQTRRVPVQTEDPGAGTANGREAHVSG